MNEEQEQELLDELLTIAMQYFPDAFELAIKTNDEDLFHKVMAAANRIAVDHALAGLIIKGLVEVEGLDENGEPFFQLTDTGKRAVNDFQS